MTILILAGLPASHLCGPGFDPRSGHVGFAAEKENGSGEDYLRILRFPLSVLISLTTACDRAIAQAVTRWLPTAAARVRARVWSSGICGGQSGAGAGFLRVLRFPLPIFIPPNSPS
jgi:hypothetical protein